MKSFKEWKEENYNEFFGMPRTPQPQQNAQPAQPQQNIQSQQVQPQKQVQQNIQSQQPAQPQQQVQQNQQKLNCPFCNAPTVSKRLDSSYYPTTAYAFQCEKCFKYWPSENLDPSQAKSAASLIENNLCNLYLSGLVPEDTFSKSN